MNGFATWTLICVSRLLTTLITHGTFIKIFTFLEHFKVGFFHDFIPLLSQVLLMALWVTPATANKNN
jgi:hypothetical protein